MKGQVMLLHALPTGTFGNCKFCVLPALAEVEQKRCLTHGWQLERQWLE